MDTQTDTFSAEEQAEINVAEEQHGVYLPDSIWYEIFKTQK